MKIGHGAFYNCLRLNEIHLHVEDPYTIEATFEESDVKNVTLFVPVGTGYAYRHHPEFKKFKEVVIERIKE